MVLGEVIQLGALEIQHADHLSLVDHRDGEFGAGFGIGHQIARIGRHIGYQNRFTRRCRRPNDTFACCRAQFSLDSLAMLNIETMAKDLLLLVIQHDAQNLVINHALDQFGGATEQGLHIEDGADLPANLVQDQQGFSLSSHLLEQSRVFDGDGKAIRQHREDILLFPREVVEVAALDVKHADALPAEHQRHGKFRTDAFDRVYVAGVLRDVAYKHGVAGACGRSRDSLPYRNF